MTDPSMVVEFIDQDLQKAIVTLRQYNSKFIISKPRSAALFSIKLDTGPTPKELDGKYTSLESAIRRLKEHSLVAKETFKVKSDRLEKDRKERHAAATQSGNGK